MQSRCRVALVVLLMALLIPARRSDAQVVRSFPSRLGCASSLGESEFDAAYGQQYVFACDGLVFSDGTTGTTRLIPSTWGNFSSGPIVGQKVFFTSSDLPSTIWSTDGTVDGTRSCAPWHGYVQEWMFAGREAYFIGGQNRLWRTDGTADGTFPLEPALYPVGGAEVDGMFFVLAFGPPARTVEALWTTDGTTTGTAQVALVAIPRGSESGRWGVSGDLFYFRSGSGEGGEEIWRSNGTSAGTFRLADIVPGPQGSSPAFITAAPRPGAPNGVYFLANGESGADEVWYSDGTPDGTGRVIALPAGKRLAPWTGFKAAGSIVFFIVNLNGVGDRGRLWVSDGTATGTHEVGGLEPTQLEVWGLATCRGRAYFSFDGLRLGRELWTSDGTLGGTHLLFDLLPSSSPGGLYGGFTPVVVNSRIYFGSYNFVSGAHTWVLNVCPADFDNDGQVLVDDVYAYLAAYFGGVDRADVDDSGTLGVQDVLQWLTEYLSGCNG